jgi:heme oxygenase (mycobilin-producing)
VSGQIRVLLYHRTGDAAGLATAYRSVSERLAAVPGQLGNELLRDLHDPEVFVVLSRWSSRAAFDAWEQGVGHRDSTADLRPYRDIAGGRPFAVFAVTDVHTAAPVARAGAGDRR